MCIRDSDIRIQYNDGTYETTQLRFHAELNKNVDIEKPWLHDKYIDIHKLFELNDNKIFNEYLG